MHEFDTIRVVAKKHAKTSTESCLFTRGAMAALNLNPCAPKFSAAIAARVMNQLNAIVLDAHG